MGRPLAKQPIGFEQLRTVVSDRLSKNLRIRRNLPGGGRLRIDRQLPFLCVYRQPPGRSDIGTRQLVTTEAAYLFASGDTRHQGGLQTLVGAIASVLTEHFGAFLLLEMWASTDPPTFAAESRPAFRIHCADAEALPGTIDAMAEALRQIVVQGRAARVQAVPGAAAGPPGLEPLRPICPDRQGSCFYVGLEVSPVYRQEAMLFPVVLHQLRRGVSVALRKGIFAFTGVQKRPREKHFDAFGPSTMVRAARDVDQQLCDVSDAFDFLLQVTPVNAEAAWQAFSESGCDVEPVFRYRHLPYQPNLLKRRLFEAPIERIEDPTLSHLFWEKQNELDLQLTALRELETEGFLHCSRQLYGSVDNPLLELARNLLDRLPCPPAPDACPEAEEEARDVVPISQVVARAREEFDHYRQQLPQFAATLELSESIASGIMVSRGKLIVSEGLRLSAARLEPLLHHEIGTHLLTYFNGRCQPFRQLSSGLAKYEPLQEGLAVLAEYLTGGLSAGRLRMLAARVIAVHAMDNGASFIDTYRRLTREHGIASRAAFTTTLRAFRGGGLTKDGIYLRGLTELLEFLSGGHDLEPLYVGKIALSHLPYMQELRRRRIVLAPKVLPRFWGDAQLRERLEACRRLSVLDLAGGV